MRDHNNLVTVAVNVGVHNLPPLERIKVFQAEYMLAARLREDRTEANAIAREALAALGVFLSNLEGRTHENFSSIMSAMSSSAYPETVY